MYTVFKNPNTHQSSFFQIPSSLMADLPTDVITDILSRLPVKSLLQFRSTSKSWRSLIDSDNFKTLHLNNFRKLNSSLILHDNYELYVVDFPTLGNPVLLKHPFMTYHNSITILGSCNGLLCIKKFGQIAIWNPSLCKHRILPCGPNIHITFFNGSRTYGFGFDPLTGDYKLVEISYLIDGGSTVKSKVNLFSCRTNTWKTLPNIPYALRRYKTKSVFVDHSLHWAVSENRKLTYPKLIVAFDLRFEVFNEVPLPKLGEGFEIEVSQLGGCLSMVVNHQFPRIDIWVMKQYGSKDSWFKLFCLVEQPDRWWLRSLKYVKPLGYSSDRMKVLFKQDHNKVRWYDKDVNYKLFWYDLKSKQVSDFTIQGMPTFNEAMIWVESLVKPPFPSENYRKQQKEQQELECKNNTSKRKCLRS